jgi:hypothetical protein
MHVLQCGDVAAWMPSPWCELLVAACFHLLSHAGLAMAAAVALRLQLHSLLM